MKTKINLLTTLLALIGLNIKAQEMVKDVNPTEKMGSFHNNTSPMFTNVNGLLYFEIKTDLGLWKSDGTEEGTKLSLPEKFPRNICNMNGSLFFFEYSASTNKSELFKFTPGDLGKNTADKFKELEVIAEKYPIAQVYSKGVPMGLLTVVNNILFFVVDQTQISGKYELWKTDGTKNGTANLGIVGLPTDLIKCGNLLFFTFDDGNHGRELWKSDGTLEGTKMLKDINSVNTKTGDTKSSGISKMTDVNGILFFVADDGVHGKELWKTDGTEEGTKMVKDIGENENGSNKSGIIIGSESGNFINVNGSLFFTIGTYLWKSDGTEGGTVMVKDLKHGIKQSNGSMYYKKFAGSIYETTCNVNGILFFALDDGLHGVELWKSDGTSIGTIMVKNIKTPQNSINDDPGSNPGKLTNVNDTLYFAADDGIHGKELWKSDGTEAGTIMVKDINPSGNFGSEPHDLLYIHKTKTLFFTADDGPHGRELWKLELIK